MLQIRTLAILLAVVTVSCARPVPETPERPVCVDPVLTERDGAFAFDGGLSDNVTVEREVMLNELALRTQVPLGWSGSAVGNAAWFSPRQVRARFVLYPPELPGDSHLSRVRGWYEADAADPNMEVSPLMTGSGARQPVLYAFRRLDDGRRGLVYGVLTGPAGNGPGIVLTGTWPGELDCELRGPALRAANGARLREL